MALNESSVRQRYQRLWNELSGWKLFLFYMLHYTALFLILQWMVFSDFREAGKSFIWTADAIPIYLARMSYFSQTMREAIQSLFSGQGWTVPLYDFKQGYSFLQRFKFIKIMIQPKSLIVKQKSFHKSPKVDRRHGL